MKRLARRSKFLFLLWLCAFSLLDFKSLAGLVVCVGEDGHVALESSSDGDCCHAEDASPALSHAQAAPGTDHCGGCRDLSIRVLASNASLASRAFSSGLSAPASLSMAPILAAYLSAPDPGSLPIRSSERAPACGQTFLPAIRTVVLTV